jgi:thiol:disulfide interchange protein
MKNEKKWLLAILTILFFVFIINCKKNQPSPDSAKIQWIYSVDSALVLSGQTQKPIMIDFMAEWCPPCRAMEDSTFNNQKIIEKSADFITVRIDIDKQSDIAIQYGGNARKYGGVGIPNLLFLSPRNEKIKHVIGFHNAAHLSAVMDSVLLIYESSAKQD